MVVPRCAVADTSEGEPQERPGGSIPSCPVDLPFDNPSGSVQEVGLVEVDPGLHLVGGEVGLRVVEERFGVGG